VYGAKSVAKSGGLQKKAAEWRKKGHPVIDINLKGIPPTYSDFRTVFRTAVQASKKQSKFHDRKKKIESEKKAQTEIREVPHKRKSSKLFAALVDAIRAFMSPIFNAGQLLRKLCGRKLWMLGESPRYC